MKPVMYTTTEKKNIKKLLSRAANPDDAFNLEELHGFLFGIAILPELIKPSEWMPIAFGEEMFEFDSQDEAKLLTGHLFALYNRLNAENQKRTLIFPFDIGELKTGDVQRMSDWTYGLFEAMAFMPEVWHWNESAQRDEDDEDLSEDEQELISACGIILGIAEPENIPELFEKDTSYPEKNKSDLELQATLFVLLPKAILVICKHARLIAEIRNKTMPYSMPIQSVGKVGRNEACPCGSGKKYKKCCGLN